MLRPISRSALAASLVLGALVARAPAQSINVNCGFGAPSAAYGAGSGQAGTWNTLGHGTFPMVDLAGTPTGVVASHSGCDASGCAGCDLGCGTLVPGTDDAALLGSWHNGDCYADPSVTSVSGLEAGSYRMHVYAYHACTPSTLSSIAVRVVREGTTLFTSGFNLGGVTWNGTWSGFPYQTVLLTIGAGDSLTLGNGTMGSYGGLSGFQLTKLDTFEPACSGDGTSIACPCGNSGAPGHGCANSQFVGGALLAATGLASVTSDSVVLQGWDMPNASCTYFQGTVVNPMSLYDGIRCVAGSVLRIGSKINVGHASTYPEAGDASVSVRGQVPAAGATFYYTASYRNAAAYCTPGTANFTNAIAITWTP